MASDVLMFRQRPASVAELRHQLDAGAVGDEMLFTLRDEIAGFGTDETRAELISLLHILISLLHLLFMARNQIAGLERVRDNIYADLVARLTAAGAAGGRLGVVIDLLMEQDRAAGGVYSG